MTWPGRNHTHHIDDDYIVTQPSMDGQHSDLLCKKCNKRLVLAVIPD